MYTEKDSQNTIPQSFFLSAFKEKHNEQKYRQARQNQLNEYSSCYIFSFHNMHN